MRDLKMKLKPTLLVIIAFLSTNALNAQNKQELRKEFEALEQRINNVYEKYDIKDNVFNDVIDETFSEEPKMKFTEKDEKDAMDFEQQMGNISDADIKTNAAEGDMRMFQEFVASYEDYARGKDLKSVLSTLSKEEKESLKAAKTASEKKRISKNFQMEKEIAEIEHKMYIVAKKYIGSK